MKWTHGQTPLPLSYVRDIRMLIRGRGIPVCDWHSLEEVILGGVLKCSMVSLPPLSLHALFLFLLLTLLPFSCQLFPPSPLALPHRTTLTPFSLLSMLLPSALHPLFPTHSLALLSAPSHIPLSGECINELFMLSTNGHQRTWGQTCSC